VKVSIIAAVARNGAIGKGNQLLWHDPIDQKHFRAVTMGCPVIMGRNTWDSLPAKFRPLPGRRNVIVTRDAMRRFSDAETSTSLEDALAMLQDAPQVFVIGGAQLYAQALPLADELVLTEIDADLKGDVFFPKWEPSAYRRASQAKHVAADGTPFAITVYRRTD
jgi:dihydrofolate reductase